MRWCWPPIVARVRLSCRLPPAELSLPSLIHGKSAQLQLTTSGGRSRSFDVRVAVVVIKVLSAAAESRAVVKARAILEVLIIFKARLVEASTIARSRSRARR